MQALLLLLGQSDPIIIVKRKTFSGIFHPKFFWHFFSWNQSCQQLKKSKTTAFSRIFHPKKTTIFSGNQSWILANFRTKNEDFEQCVLFEVWQIFVQFLPHLRWRQWVYPELKKSPFLVKNSGLSSFFSGFILTDLLDHVMSWKLRKWGNEFQVDLALHFFIFCKN